jgi:hypothetical protein
MNENIRDDIKFLLNLLPNWAQEVPKGLDAMFYGTLRYEDDLKIKNKIDQIKERYMI